MPTRSSPSDGPAQIEYERRCSLPAMVSFSVRCWPCVKRNCSASSAGTSNETTTASSVSGRTLLTRKGWKCSATAGLDGLEMFEKLAAGAAAPQGLARGGAKRSETLGVLAFAAWAGERRHGARHEANRNLLGDVDAPGRHDAVAAQLRFPRVADPVARPRGRALHADARRAQTGLVERGDDAGL